MARGYFSHYSTRLSETEIKTLRRVTRILAKLNEQAQLTLPRAPDFYALGGQVDRIILDHTVGGQSPQLEP